MAPPQPSLLIGLVLLALSAAGLKSPSAAEPALAIRLDVPAPQDSAVGTIVADVNDDRKPDLLVIRSVPATTRPSRADPLNIRLRAREIKQMLEPSGRAYKGPSPKKPETIELALHEMLKATENWLRRYEESWFDRRSPPALEPGFAPWGDYDEVPLLCDEAIEALSDLASFAEDAQERLQKLKRRAKGIARSKQEAVRQDAT